MIAWLRRKRGLRQKHRTMNIENCQISYSNQLALTHRYLFSNDTQCRLLRVADIALAGTWSRSAGLVEHLTNYFHYISRQVRAGIFPESFPLEGWAWEFSPGLSELCWLLSHGFGNPLLQLDCRPACAKSSIGAVLNETTQLTGGNVTNSWLGRNGNDYCYYRVRVDHPTVYEKSLRMKGLRNERIHLPTYSICVVAK